MILSCNITKKKETAQGLKNNFLQSLPFFCLRAKSMVSQGCVKVVSRLCQSYDRVALELHGSEVKARRYSGKCCPKCPKCPKCPVPGTVGHLGQRGTTILSDKAFVPVGQPSPVGQGQLFSREKMRKMRNFAIFAA